MLSILSIKKIHFIGIGGVSLSSFARYFLSKNISVSGSDRVYSSVLDDLREHGARIVIGFEPQFIGRPDLVVFSSAIKDNDVEYLYCKSLGVPVVERYELLTALSGVFPSTVAVAGTHGKTTVTGMCAEIFIADSVPLFTHIGGFTKNFGNFFYSGDELFLTEACEYRRSLLHVKPSIGAVLNAEFDHPDTFTSLSEVYDCFDEFLSSSETKIVNGDCEYYEKRQYLFNPITFGLNGVRTYGAQNITMRKNGCMGFTLTHLGFPILDIELNVPGKHNVIDALAAATICLSYGASVSAVKKGLLNFYGIKRRFEYVGEYFSRSVYCDYAHHPTEIICAYKTARSMVSGKLTAVFQPHTYSRTAALEKEFLDALEKFDEVIILKEYAARERPCDGIGAKALYDALRVTEKTYVTDVMEAAVKLTELKTPGGAVLVLGAGDIVNLCKIISPDFTF